MVTFVNGIVVDMICWLASPARNDSTWLSIWRICSGPALLKLLARSVRPPPAVVVKVT